MKNTGKCHILLMNLEDASYTPGFLTEYLAFGYLAGSLRSQGHRVTWLDEYASGPYDPENFNFKDYFPVDIVGMSPSFATYRRVLQWLAKWKQYCPGVITVIGGQHVMLIAREVLMESETVDLICMGEGESPIYYLAENVCKNRNVFDTPGFAFKDKTHHYHYHENLLEHYPSMDELPFPARDVLEKWLRQKRISQVSVQNSRGCAFNCNFCHFPAIRKRKTSGYNNRSRSPAHVISELVYLQDTYGFREFFFNSPQFGGIGEAGRKWMREFAGLLNVLKRDIRFEIECRADTLNDRELILHLKKAGLIRVFLGLEAGYEDGLIKFQKGITIDTQKEIVAALRSQGISVSGSGFIMIHPLAGIEGLQKNAEFLWELKETHINSLWSVFRLFPGIQLNDELERRGLVGKDRRHDQVFNYNFMDPRVGKLNAKINVLLSSNLIKLASRLVRLVDIEINLEEANLPALYPGVNEIQLRDLLDIRDSGMNLRNTIITIFFYHFLDCLKTASREFPLPEWERTGRHLHQNLLNLKSKIDSFLKKHDTCLYSLLRHAMRKDMRKEVTYERRN